MDYVQQIKKTPVVVNDSRGFYTSRCFGMYPNEGITMLAEGVKPALIENAAKMAGMPVGPLAVSDEVTIELQYKIMSQHQKDLGDDWVKPSSYEAVKRFVEDLDRKGKRYGKGFYDYPEGQKKHLWPGLGEVFPVSENQPSVAEIQKRLLYIQSLETARCLEEGVVTEPADADIGSILGWGFPPWTGGTITFIDTIGIADFVAECERLADTYGERFRPSAWLKAKAEKNEPFYGAAAQAERSAA
jgi:3-hydroxyacyl-CoA dehydrogenase/enoyl-CoA hydratase/3-hydroxybutyryl-CoA epimerase